MYPERTRERKYPNKLNTTRDRDELTGLCLLGTMDTTIPGGGVEGGVEG